MKHFITSTIIASSIAVAAFAASDAMDPDEAINARQEAMKTIGASMKTLSPMAKGDVDFDHDAANEALAKINMAAQELPMMFPEGSETGVGHEDHETEASPKIWEEPEAFEAATQKFINDTSSAVESDPQSAEELGATIGMFAGNCKACHQEFRIKKD